MPTDAPIRLSDIAARARTSISTVSLALSGDPRISSDTRQRIRELSQELGYRPRRSFRGELTRRIAHEQDRLRFGFLAVEAQYNPNHAMVFQALSQITSAQGISLEVVSIPPNAEPHALVDRATEFGRRVDGLILTNVVTVEQLRQIEQAGVPTVMYGYPMGAPDGNDVPPVPIVTSDWVSMGRRATQALIDIGHRRIGFISGELIPNMWHERCYDGYTTALIHADLPVDKSIVFTAKPADPRAGSSAAPVFLAMKESRPTAYLAVNPGTAGRFVEAMRDSGVSIGPRELVVCGYPHRMDEFALDNYPLVYMDPAKIVSAAIMQLRAKCLHQNGGNFTVLVPFSTQNLPKKTD